MKYGGVKFRNLVPPVKINRFVNKLATSKKASLFEIASELSDAGMIEILNERTQSTIDKDTLDDQTPNNIPSNEEVYMQKRFIDPPPTELPK